MAICKVGLRKIKRKKGFVYQIDYSLNGKRIREVIGSNKNEAEVYRSTIHADLVRGKLGVKEMNEKTSLTSLYIDYINLKQNLHEDSKKRYKNYFDQFEYFLKQFFPQCTKDISQIKSHYIKESIDHLITKGTKEGKTWQPRTANGYKDFLASLFKFALKKNKIIENPVADIPDLNVSKKANVEFYSQEEIIKILNSVSISWKNFINFILNTGLRQGEIEFLPWDHVFITKGFIQIKAHRGWNPKRNKSRIVYLNDTAISIIKSQIGKNDTFVFTLDDGNKINENQSYKILKPIFKKLNIDGDIHKFRHTFGANFMMSESGTIYDLAEIMGHDDIETTKIYAHLSPSHLQKRMKNLDKK